MLNLLPLTCIVLAALASASAVPTSDPKPKQCKPRGKEKVYTASYDDLPFTEGDQPPTPIGDDYLGLKYTNFYVVRPLPPVAHRPQASPTHILFPQHPD